jgi:HEPN domain-containing protein
MPGVYLEDLCFDAQQAAEKAIKAVFIYHTTPYPYIHNLADLLKRLQRSGVKVPKYVLQADELSPFAVLTRYPGLVSPVTKRQHLRAVRVAEAVLRWAERQV